MKYTIKTLRKDFPNDDRCLEYIFRSRFPKSGEFHREKNTKTYTHQKGYKHIYPLKGTIFENSRTPLTLWFYAIYLFSVSKNGVSAKELQRQLGVTYKCAWRMAAQIRSLMEQGNNPLTGIVEADETYINGKPILGVIERGGDVRVSMTENRKLENIVPFVYNNIESGATLITDNNTAYRNIPNVKHRPVKYNKFAKGKFAPTSMEAFWGNLKRSISGTHHYVSPKHLQSYLDYFSFQHSHRTSEVPLFLVLLGKACE